MFGQENQRAAIAGSRNGVHTLTADDGREHGGAERQRPAEHALLQRPLGLHDEEAGAEQRVAAERAPAPVKTLNGVSQSNQPPA